MGKQTSSFKKKHQKYKVGVKIKNKTRDCHVMKMGNRCSIHTVSLMMAWNERNHFQFKRRVLLPQVCASDNRQREKKWSLWSCRRNITRQERRSEGWKTCGRQGKVGAKRWGFKRRWCGAAVCPPPRVKYQMEKGPRETRKRRCIITKSGCFPLSCLPSPECCRVIPYLTLLLRFHPFFVFISPALNYHFSVPQNRHLRDSQHK